MLFVHINEIMVEGRSLVLQPGESLSDAVPVGQPVEFSLAQALVDLRDADFARLKQKPAAQNVVMLRLEDIPADSALRIEGTVTRIIQGVKRNRHEGYGGVIKYIQSGTEGEGEDTTETGGQGEASGVDGVDGTKVEGAAAAKFVGFEGSDLDGNCPVVKVGDQVSFVLKNSSLATDPPKRAHGVLLVKPASSSGPVPPTGGGESKTRTQGVVCKLSLSRFGFIRAVDAEKQVFFHMDEVPAESQETLCVGSEVSFQVCDDYRTGKKIARSLIELPKGTISFEDKCGRFTGTIVRPAVAPRIQGVADGLVQFEAPEPEGEEEGGAAGAAEGGERPKVEVLFGTHCIDDPRLRLGPGDVVSFDCLQNKATRSRRITRVELVRRAEGRPGDEARSGEGQEQGGGEGRSPGRSLGRLTAIKKSFGFIRSVTEVADIFFHFDNLHEGVDRSMLSPGMDVEFTLKVDPVNNRTHAVQVSLAPKGTVVFEAVGDEVFCGVVVESASKGQSGLVRAEIDGQTAHLPFSFGEVEDPRMNPRVDEMVQFRVITDVKRERAAEAIGKEGLGRRATGVHLAPRPGKVLDIVGSYGFIQCKISAEELAVRLKKPQNFHSDELPPHAGLDTSALTASEGGEAEAPPAAPAAQGPLSGTDRGRVFFHETAVLGGAKLSPGDEVEFVLATTLYKDKYDLNARAVRRTKVAGEMKSEARPDSLKFTGGRKGVAMATPQMRLAKGPDGTPGFHPGRGRRLSPPPGTHESPPGLALGEVSSRTPPPSTEELIPLSPVSLEEAGPVAGDMSLGGGDPASGGSQMTNGSLSEAQLAQIIETALAEQAARFEQERIVAATHAAQETRTMRAQLSDLQSVVTAMREDSELRRVANSTRLGGTGNQSAGEISTILPPPTSDPHPGIAGSPLTMQSPIFIRGPDGELQEVSDDMVRELAKRIALGEAQASD